MDRSKFLLSQAILCPEYSTKTIGHIAAADLKKVAESLELALDPSIIGIEQLYSLTGWKISGPTEVRWAFRYNDLRPRVYFARGSDQYYASHYIQQILNIILDLFPPVNRRFRYLIDVIRLSQHDTLFIYDYSSFTSILHEIRNFTASLSRYFADVVVSLVDSHRGVIQVLRMTFETC
jgi:hypothetical protein